MIRKNIVKLSMTRKFQRKQTNKDVDDNDNTGENLFVKTQSVLSTSALTVSSEHFLGTVK